jgi:hypothetical protein
MWTSPPPPHQRRVGFTLVTVLSAAISFTELILFSDLRMKTNSVLFLYS